MEPPGLLLLSDRFVLRPIDTDDVDDVHAIWTDENVRRFLFDGETIPIDQTREIVEKNHALFAQQGYGIWGIREQGTDQLVGFAGLWHFRTPPALELLFGVSYDHWNRGIATESSRRVIQYAFADLELGDVDASTDAGNAASIRVLEKLGMSFTRRDVVDELDTVFYKLSRATWQSSLRTGLVP